MEVTSAIIAERMVAKQLSVVPLSSLMQPSSIDVVETILDVELDWGRYLS